MSKLTSTLYVDGNEIERGSVEAVVLYERLLREAYAKLDEASQLLACVPEPVEQTWRKLHRKADQATYTLVGKVALFGADFATRGLEVAVTDASFRGDL